MAGWRFKLWSCVVLWLCLCGLFGVAAAQEFNYTPICQELEQAGLKILGTGMA